MCGNKKELRKAKVLRLLSDKRLTSSYQNVVINEGLEINFYEKDEIECNLGNIERILPFRNENSYKINGSKVQITDKKIFWSTSKSIVLITK